MKPITLEPILHRNIERILIRYDYNSAIHDLVKTLPGARWSQTYKAWHLPMNDGAQEAALCLLRPVKRQALRSAIQYS
jgi:hypothetical protein